MGMIARSWSRYAASLALALTLMFGVFGVAGVMMPSCQGSPGPCMIHH